MYRQQLRQILYKLAVSLVEESDRSVRISHPDQEVQLRVLELGRQADGGHQVSVAEPFDLLAHEVHTHAHHWQVLQSDFADQRTVLAAGVDCSPEG